MEPDVFRRMQKQLDQYGLGFPATDSGVELDLLKELFSEEDAALFTLLTAELETPESIARRTERPVGEVTDQLEGMAQKGLLFRRRVGGSTEYGAIPFIHGLLEFQIKRMSTKLVKLAGEYIKERFKEEMARNIGAFQRTIPVQESVEVAHHVAPYDDAYEILRRQELIVLTPCACRTQRRMFGKDCGKPREVCFMFGPMGQYYIDNGLGRQIDLREALEVLRKAQDAGLITQPAAAQNPFTMCSCCGDCCGFLHAIRKYPRPAELVFSNYVATMDEGRCSGCGICVERCSMGARSIDDQCVSAIDPGRCIGCGLCVTTCPEKATRLEPKPGAHRVPPAGTPEQMRALASKRGLDADDPAQIASFGFRNF